MCTVVFLRCSSPAESRAVPPYDAGLPFPHVHLFLSVPCPPHPFPLPFIFLFRTVYWLCWFSIVILIQPVLLFTLCIYMMNRTSYHILIHYTIPTHPYPPHPPSLTLSPFPYPPSCCIIIYINILAIINIFYTFYMLFSIDLSYL